MKRFHFSLETLLTLRQRVEDAIKEELAHKNKEIALAQDALRCLHDELKQLQVSEKNARQKALSVGLLLQGVAYRHSLKAQMLFSARRIDDLSAESEQIRMRLVKARQKTRAVELLKEHRQGAWKKEQGRFAQRFMDEVAQQGFIRGQARAQA